ncbi:hypothetical protein T12_13818 [Trichinella patagoniensis]|uniref:Uncharacterized protein n=1 Tax=Trichinella patagoniensis TaxID=990121 RepID=A0A0V0YWF6_9BILA|nr:hypothetical protein T12_13818 [Trichinella patagoniensis]
MDKNMLFIPVSGRCKKRFTANLIAPSTLSKSFLEMPGTPNLYSKDGIRVSSRGAKSKWGLPLRVISMPRNLIKSPGSAMGMCWFSSPKLGTLKGLELKTPLIKEVQGDGE